MKEAVSIVVLKDGHAYLGRREGKDNHGKLGFPGGKKEQFDSSPEASAVRELLEEMGLASQTLTPLGEMQLFSPDFGEYLCHAFCLSLPSEVEPNNIEPHKNGAWAKVPIGQLFRISDSLLLPGTKLFVQMAVRQLEQSDPGVTEWMLNGL